MRKHSVTIRGHRTSYSLEEEFHAELTAIALRRSIALAALIGEIDEARARDANLSSAIRVYVLGSVRHGRATGG